uniref:Uncharacterized protein n=1 Tax=Strigamia maritima TaxID=126957 RepID=T1JIM5_STRMM
MIHTTIINEIILNDYIIKNTRILEFYNTENTGNLAFPFNSTTGSMNVCDVRLYACTSTLIISLVSLDCLHIRKHTNKNIIQN